MVNGILNMIDSPFEQRLSSSVLSNVNRNDELNLVGRCGYC